MRIGVLDFCIWLPEYQHDQARFGDLVAVWARRGLPEAEYEVIDVTGGADLPATDGFDGFILSGSEMGVYDAVPWMQPLRAFLESIRHARKPVFGICFGHQIMADVFGGKAEKVGPQQVGVRRFEIDGDIVSGHVWHQDQVTQIPPDAQVIGSADYCPVAALRYDFPAMSVQFHPEYEAGYVAKFLRRSRGAVLSETETDRALAEIEAGQVQADLFSNRMAGFFRTHI